ncbi:MAG TPA: HupE/UreJ family protein [Gammaproteobacteria bacterium]|nr:HupE/UreJ family protein [Gammaproteobacteria bacterium]
MPNARRFAALACLAAALGAPRFALPHEIPSDATVQIIVAPGAGALRVLVRAPLESMQDVEWPIFGPGYLDIARADEPLRNAAAVWLQRDIALYADGERLPLELSAARASIPSDRSFATLDSALAHVLSPRLPAETQLVWQQALLDVLFTAPLDTADAALAIDAKLGRLGMQVTAVVRLATPDGRVRVFELPGEAGRVELDPRWYHSFARFIVLGFEHILSGADHLLFLLCLVVPFRRELRSLVLIVTAFTVGHSITLLGSAYGAAPDALWFPPLVETLIAASIFYMAVENVIAADAKARLAKTRWALALGFGVVHGFGFSFGLRNTLQLAGDHVLAALLAFNVGIELGQLLVLAALVPALNLLFRFVVAERMGVIVLSVIVGHTAWHWMVDRFEALRQFHF